MWVWAKSNFGEIGVISGYCQPSGNYLKQKATSGSSISGQFGRSVVGQKNKCKYQKFAVKFLERVLLPFFLNESSSFPQTIENGLQSNF